MSADWKPKGIKAYYEDDSVFLIHGDCREIVPMLGRFDLLLTDPPYGIDAANNKRANKQHGKAAAPSRDYGALNWDKSPPSAETLSAVISICDKCIIWGGNYFTLPPSRAWLVWDKDNGDNGYADCELAWTNLEQAVRKFRRRWMGMIQEQMGDQKEVRDHPTQKPLPLISWCLSFAPAALTVLDPFAGSGTTGVAAKSLGRKCVMIEREAKYCEIASRRCRQEVFAFDQPPPSPPPADPPLFSQSP